MTTTLHDEACDRLTAAISDGRFLEDPGLYRAHVEACSGCRARVDGLFQLRDRLEKAGLEAPSAAPAARDPKAVVGEALDRYHSHRRVRDGTVGIALLVALGVGAIYATRSPRNEPAARPEALAYAQSLHDAVAPRGAPERHKILLTDAALREKFVRALDDPSSAVRRTALDALMLAGVPLDAARLERILGSEEADLEAPLELASTTDGARELAEAINKSRLATLKSVLLAAFVHASRDGTPVRSEILRPYLLHSDSEVRLDAMLALAADAKFVPAADVESAMKRDSDPDIRAAAASSILAHRGAEGMALVVAHLRAAHDDELESRVVSVLGKAPAGLDLARARIADARTPTELALSHARNLLRAGERIVPDELIDRALAAKDPEAHLALATTAALGDWTRCRGPLQEKWRAGAGMARASLGIALASWDEQSGIAERLEMTFEILSTGRGDPRFRSIVERLSRSGVERVAERARNLLDSWPAK